MDLQVAVLGSVGVRRDGTDIELGTRQRRLLSALVVANGSVVSTDRLVEIVWDGQPPAGADTTLRSHVTRLRRALGSASQRIVFHEPGYVIDLSADELDSAMFEAELDRAVRHLRTADATTARSLLGSAIARWAGPAYAGFADEEWARPECVRLEERLIEAREDLIEAQLADGLTAEATAEAQSLVESEPLREHPRQLLMRALYASGRQAEALRVAASYRRYLVEEAGLDPSQELIELERRIARGDPSVAGCPTHLRGYELGERIGEGAFAVVHRAVQPGVDRVVAIKVIRAELADRPDFIRRFELEARTVARIEHPNVVPLYDFWREPGAAYLVMRLLPGGSVEQALRSRGPYSCEQTVRLLTDVGGALETAHRAGVVHRDVRPANLLLDADGATYLADFGIALPASAIDDLPIRSPAYAAPEVLRGEPAGVTADIMSLGVTTFEVLTARLPFADSVDRDELVRHQLSDPLPSVRATRTDLPPIVDEILARATAKAPGDRYSTVAAFVDDMRSALAPPAAGIGTTSIEWTGPVTNPYVGLHAFDEEDADLYFGREQLVTELVDMMERRSMVTVVGPSGSGKSSVVRAGLLPAVRRGAIAGSDSWFVATMIPGPDPFDALETALLRVAINPPSTLREQLAEPGGLLRAIRRVLPDDRAQLLLVVDQFEELFTQTRVADVRDRFLCELADAVTARGSPLRVVATLRADHFDAPLRHASIAELVTRGTVTVRPMTSDELGRAISLPATSVGAAVEPALVTELVAGITARPAALPLLQFSLTELFDRRVAHAMLLTTHRELGGLTGALAARADRIVANGGPDDESEVRRIFGRLVNFGEGAEDTRRRALRSEFGDGERTAWLLDAFVSARLLATDRDPATREPTVEVAHEALLRDWPRLRTWLAEDRDLRRSVGIIGAAATVWGGGGRQQSDLYRGGRLESALHIVDTSPDWLRPLDHEFLEVSRVHADTERSMERRRVRRLRRLVAGTAAALVVALVAGGLAYTQQRRAELRAEEATAATAEAELAELVARSAAAAVDRPEQALLLALEAHRREPGPATVRAVLDVVANGGFGAEVEVVDRLPDENCDYAGTWAPRRRLSLDGRWEFGVLGADALRKDLLTGEVVRQGAAPAPCGGWIEDVETGQRWANSATFDQHWVGSDLDEWIEINRRLSGGFLVPQAVGDRLLFGEEELNGGVGSYGVVVVDAASLEAVAPSVSGLSFDLWEDWQPAVAASTSAGLFAAGTYRRDGLNDADAGGLLVVLDALTGLESFRVSRPSRVTALAFSDDGSILLAGAADGSIATIDVESHEVLGVVTMSQPLEVIALGSRPDGLVVAVGARTIESFERDGEQRGSPIDIPFVEDARVRPDGAVVLVPGDEPDTLQILEPNGGALVERGWDVGTSAMVGFGARRAVAVAASGSAEVVELDSGDWEEIEFITAGGERFDPVAVQPEADGFLAWDDGRMVGRWRDGRLVEHLDLWSGLVTVGQTRANIDQRSPGGGFAGGGAVVLYEGNSAAAVYAFDPTPGRLGSIWANENPPFSTVAAVPAPDGVHVLLAGGQLRTYDPAGNRTQELATGLVDGAVAVRDPSTGSVALGGENGTVVVDPATGSVQRVTDVGAVTSLGFARDGTVLVVVESDGAVRLWDTVRAELIGTLWNGSGTASPSPPWYDESSDTVWVATSSKILEFSLEPSRWVERACDLVDRELTADEWERLVPGDSPQRPACG